MTTERTIYVAGGSLEARECARDIAALREAGWVVTLDWTEHVLSATIPDSAMSERECYRHAMADTEAVLAADWFWIRAPRTPSTGAWYELGAAVASKPISRIVYSGPRVGIFWSCAGLRFPTHEEALAELRKP